MIPKPSKRKIPPMKYADKLWSIIIRSCGKCELVGKFPHVCAGALQGMHLDGRTNYDLRHELYNGICGCQGVHTFWTFRCKTSVGQKEWERFLEGNFPRKHLRVFIGEYPKQVKRDYMKIAERLEALLRVTIIHHTYSKADQKIIDEVLNG